MLISMATYGMGELHKLNGAENLIGNSKILRKLVIRCDANYHGPTWCEIQICIWMTDLDFSHFYDKFTYIKYCIVSYNLNNIK
jgi:hypothetical protein